MAALTPVFWQTVTPAMQQCLEVIGLSTLVDRFYLAGGTAVALRLGHRRSIDLDFFSATDEVLAPTRTEILRILAGLEPAVVENSDGTLLLLALGLHVGFFSYGYRLLAPIDTVANVPVAGLEDLGLMKLDALITRGSRKDFYDLYHIAMRIPLPDLLERSEAKYPIFRDFPLMAVESMVMFEVGDRDVQPQLFSEVSWSQVKQFFVDQARQLGREWFGEII